LAEAWLGRGQLLSEFSRHAEALDSSGRAICKATPGKVARIREDFSEMQKLKE
jgi:predicted lipoprotein